MQSRGLPYPPESKPQALPCAGGIYPLVTFFPVRLFNLWALEVLLCPFLGRAGQGRLQGEAVGLMWRCIVLGLSGTGERQALAFRGWTGLILFTRRLLAKGHTMFALDPRLQQDTLAIGDFPLCRLLLMNDANYPWFILVPRREAVSELFQLDQVDQQQLWLETTRLAETLKDAFVADKMNVATLGNVVSQLHMHVIVRRREDPAWPAPVWGRLPARPYEAAEIAALQQRLRLVLTNDFQFAEG